MDRKGSLTTSEEEKEKELIRLFVLPQINPSQFHEVTPTQLYDYLTEAGSSNRNRGLKSNVYHQLAIIAKVDNNTTDLELDRLLQNDVRTLFVQTKCNKPEDLEQIYLKINTSVDRYYMESQYKKPIGLAVEISGELLTTGRMRNDSKPFLDLGHIFVLTTNEDYKYCCFQQIIYVSNLWRYIDEMKLGDIVHIGDNQISAKVVKCGSMRPVTLEVTRSGQLMSYMNVLVPHYVEAKELSAKDILDIEAATASEAQFLVIPGIRSSSFLHGVREIVNENIKLIGSINFQYLESKFIDMTDHLLELDAIWIDDLFCPNAQKQLTNVINLCNSFDKPLVGSVPLRTCNDFKKLENHARIKQMDCLLIERSPLRRKFPLIAKKLLPVRKKQIQVPSLDNISCGEGIVNFVLRSIYSIPCQGIVVTNQCPKAALAFAIPQIYCPVIVVVNNELLARTLNLRRNIKCVLFKDSRGSGIEFGIAYARKEGMFATGDFIISLSDNVDENEQICVNLRAYYLPPTPTEMR